MEIDTKNICFIFTGFDKYTDSPNSIYKETALHIQ